MSLFLRQDDQRTEVQKRVATELQDRLRKQAPGQTDDTEPAMLENQHTTRLAGMVIIVLIALLCIAVVAYAVRIS